MTRLLTGLVFLGITKSICNSQTTVAPFAVNNSSTTELRLSVAAVPVGTPLCIKTDSNFPLQIGQTVRGRLVYSVDVDNHVVIPSGTLVAGKIAMLEPDKSRRIQARLHADFTPFRKATVRFDEMIFPDGNVVPISTTLASDGAKVFELLPSASQRGGLVRKEMDAVINGAKAQIAIVMGPDKTDRLVQFFYNQLPFHPQRLNKGISWTVETKTSLIVPGSLSPAVADKNTPEEPLKGRESQSSPWIVHAYLQEPLSSATSTAGSTVRAIVAEPILAPDHSVSVPQGALLQGTITQARPARRFGRPGVLRFDFNELVLSNGEKHEHVQTSLQGIDAPDGGSLALDSEGEVKPRAQDKLAVPLILLALAARPLDRDQGDSAFGKDAVASNSLGLIGFIVGTAGGWRNVAAGFGYYGASLSIYNRWIKRGPEIVFPKDTHIIIQTTVRASKSLSEVNQ